MENQELTYLSRPDDIVIAVMGVTGSGKSTFIQYFTEEPLHIGHSLESCKDIRFPQSNQCDRRFFTDHEPARHVPSGHLRL